MLPLTRMEDPLDRALEVIASLNEAGVDYAIFGGVALNIHGIVRATEDIDVFLRAEPANIERLRKALRKVWNDPEIDGITAEDLCGQYPAVRYGPPDGTLYLDLVTRLGEAFAFDDLKVETKVIENVNVKVVTPRTLYEMKKGTVRPQDQADAAALRRAFGLADGNG